MDINIVMLTNTYKIYALYQPNKLEFAVVDNDGVVVDIGENIIELMDKYFLNLMMTRMKSNIKRVSDVTI